MPNYLSDYQVVNPNAKKILTSKLSEITFVDLKTIMANFAARQTAVRVVFSSDKEDINVYLKKLHDYNKMDDFVHNAIFIMSYFGVVFPVVERVNETFANKKLGHINFANPRLFNTIAKINVTSIGASYYKSYLSGITLVGEWVNVTKERIVRQPINRPFITDVNQIVVVPKDEQPTEEPNGYGFVPVGRILNRPDRTIGRNTYDEYSDDYAVRHVPAMINHILRQGWLEAVFNKSRVFGNFSLAERNKLKRQGVDADFELAAADYFIQTNTPTGGQGLVVSPGNPQFEAYMSFVEKLTDYYKDSCLFSSPNDTNAQKTEAEVLYDKSRDAETCAFKRQLLTQTLYEIFDEILHFEGLSAKGQEKREYNIEIQSALITNEVQLTDLIIQQINAGLISQTEGIAKLRNIDPTDAQPLAQQINDERNKQMRDFQINPQDKPQENDKKPVDEE